MLDVQGTVRILDRSSMATWGSGPHYQWSSEAALSVMTGNVGIGTWVPGGALQVGTNTLL